MQQEESSKKKTKKQQGNKSPVKNLQQQKPGAGKTEVKNANAAGQGAIGRSGEKPGPGMDEGIQY
jgi:hypothetical protein